MLGNFGKLNGLWGSRAERPARAACSTSCCRSRPSAPAASRGSTTSASAAVARRGSPAWPRARPCRRSRARRRDCDREADVLPLAQRALAIFEAPTPTGRPRAGRARRPLRDLLVRAQPARAQRLHPVADRPLRLRAPRRRPARHRAVPGRRAARRAREVPAYDTGAWSLYSRGSSTQRVVALLPRPPAGLPGQPLHAHQDRRLLHDRRALRAVQERAADGGGAAAHAARRAAGPGAASRCRRSRT